jgi:hypothetical protein
MGGGEPNLASGPDFAAGLDRADAEAKAIVD